MKPVFTMARFADRFKNAQNNIIIVIIVIKSQLLKAVVPKYTLLTTTNCYIFNDVDKFHYTRVDDKNIAVPL